MDTCQEPGRVTNASGFSVPSLRRFCSVLDPGDEVGVPMLGPRSSGVRAPRATITPMEIKLFLTFYSHSLEVEAVVC